MYFPKTTWTRLFLAVAVVQCVSAVLLETYVFIRVHHVTLLSTSSYLADLLPFPIPLYQ